MRGIQEGLLGKIIKSIRKDHIGVGKQVRIGMTLRDWISIKNRNMSYGGM